jgi:hypothetical protein
MRHMTGEQLLMYLPSDGTLALSINPQATTQDAGATMRWTTARVNFSPLVLPSS